MPQSTPNGYPYPVGTDRVTDGDDAIHALATAVDTQLGAEASGAGSVTTTGANPSNGALAVTFPAGRFSKAPRVNMQQTSQIANAASPYSTVYPGGITTSGFTANARRADAQTVSFMWSATTVDVA